MNGKYIKFREEDFKRDLKKAIGGVFDKVTKDVYSAMTNNLAQLKVRKVDAEHVTSFPGALINVNRNTKTSFVKHYGMSNKTPNQSFRALYYEYGTGSNMQPPTGWSPNSDMNNWNPVRPKKAGSPIYYRGGKWQDLGGNWHKGGVKPGVKKLIPRKNVYGHPVRAQFWFRNALREGTRNLDDLILQAVKSVPITAYIKIRDIRVRM